VDHASLTIQDTDLMDLTFVFPCLNEEATIVSCIEAVKQSLEGGGPALRYEIVVADNGSTDRSAELATSAGARVVPVAARGYGAALRGGIEAALGTYVMFADADMTYVYEDALPLYQKAVEVDADMAIASRMRGTIEPGAMPALHRWLGTPVLTGLINVLCSTEIFPTAIPDFAASASRPTRLGGSARVAWNSPRNCSSRR
jgi:glycosyltransferase involved in cell wall biosynthesis